MTDYTSARDTDVFVEVVGNTLTVRTWEKSKCSNNFSERIATIIKKHPNITCLDFTSTDDYAMLWKAIYIVIDAAWHLPLTNIEFRSSFMSSYELNQVIDLINDKHPTITNVLLYGYRKSRFPRDDDHKNRLVAALSNNTTITTVNIRDPDGVYFCK